MHARNAKAAAVASRNQPCEPRSRRTLTFLRQATAEAEPSLPQAYCCTGHDSLYIAIRTASPPAEE